MFQDRSHRAERVIDSRDWNHNVQVVDRVASARWIAIDEISYREGHRCLTLGPDRAQQLTHVSTDVADPCRLVFWTTAAVAGVRRQVWNTARRTPASSGSQSHDARTINLTRGDTKALKRARYTLRKNLEALTRRQAAERARIENTRRYLHRTCLLREDRRPVLKFTGTESERTRSRRPARAAHCRIPEFVRRGGRAHFACRIRRHLNAVDAGLKRDMNDTLAESANTSIRPITRMAFDFRLPDNLIALVLLPLDGQRPALLGRSCNPHIRRETISYGLL